MSTTSATRCYSSVSISTFFTVMPFCERFFRSFFRYLNFIFEVESTRRCNWFCCSIGISNYSLRKINGIACLKFDNRLFYMGSVPSLFLRIRSRLLFGLTTNVFTFRTETPKACSTASFTFLFVDLGSTENTY